MGCPTDRTANQWGWEVASFRRRALGNSSCNDAIEKEFSNLFWTFFSLLNNIAHSSQEEFPSFQMFFDLFSRFESMILHLCCRVYTGIINMPA